MPTILLCMTHRSSMLRVTTSRQINEGKNKIVVCEIYLGVLIWFTIRFLAGLRILCEKVVMGASYNSEQRFPPPNCHPETRLQILEVLRRWITCTHNATSIFWLYGAAGVGKSAVAQTISEEFKTTQLAATFFFSRADPSRNHLLSFFTTISYQLATSLELGRLLQNPIQTAVCDNPGILCAGLEEQYQKLMLKPCSRLTAEQWNSLPRLIVIDGLDECTKIPSQQCLLSIIRQIKTPTSPLHLPFKFLICSRPEPRIRSAFSHPDFCSVLNRADLGDEKFESGKDITTLLRHGFGAIRQEHGPSMVHVPENWPGNDIIEQLVQKACGQFIYATTVLKYIGDHDRSPTKQLEIILGITVPPNHDSPYPDLDLLYQQILSSCPQLPLLIDVMAHILSPAGFFFDERYHNTSRAVIEGIFSLAKGEVWALLSRLHSVLFVPETDWDYIKAYHASFIDFLTDPERSKEFFVNTDKKAQNERILIYLLKIISNLVVKNQKDHFVW